MKIAVEGCAHGELEKIYDTIQCIEKAENIKVDLLLCCGDFQSTRNLEDLQTMAVPQKYLDMCTFYKYYSGELVAPILTIFIGGNHEASNHLQELPYGGWVAPNIYYLGYAGVIRVNGIRIAGLSGIYKGHDYLRGRFEFAPYTDATRTSVYHVRQLEVFRLKQLSGTIDIFMSHDWPRNIYNYGNKAQLARFKPHFRDEMDNGQLGSRPCEDLLKLLKPKMWFAAHLHCKFAAVVTHDEDSDDGLVIDDDQKDSTKQTETKREQEERVTKFLALDKCLPRRRFLQVLDIACADELNEGLRLEYDLEWLTILYLTNHLTNVKPAKYYLPGPQNSASGERYNFTPTEEELAHVRKKFGDNLIIPKNFCRTVEPYNPSNSNVGHVMQTKAQINPQSQQFCDLLGIDDPVSLAMVIGGHELSYSSSLNDSATTDLNDSSISMLTDQTSLNMSSSTDASSQQSTPYKRTTMGLSLPKPIAEVFGADDDTDGSTLESPEKKVKMSPDELELEQSTDDEKVEEKQEFETNITHGVAVSESVDVSTKSAVKQFKRRNQAVYMDINTNDEET